MKELEGLAQAIYELLIRRKYNRGKPFLEEGVRILIDTAVSKNEPIKLVGFWGTGPKDKPNFADVKSCEFLNKLNADIKEIYQPGIEFTFIFADSHGLHNGYSKANIDSYIEGMVRIFNQYHFKYVYLHNLWEKYDVSFEKIARELQRKPQDWWAEISQSEMIEKNASHRNKSYSPEVGAKKYYVMRDLEKPMLEKEFKGYIFHAYSDPKLHVVLPSMPTLYFYGRESWSNAPWFVIDA